MSATTDAIETLDAADGQISLVSGILREAIDLCDRLRQAAQAAENARREIGEVRRQVEGGAS